MPVLRLLKGHLPSSAIYWWIESSLAPLLEGDPDLAGILRFERQRWAKPAAWRHFWRTLRWVRQEEFDWVIDLQCLARSATFAWLANGRLTVGLDEKREGARGFYDIFPPRPPAGTHAVDRYLDVLRLLRVPTDRAFEWMPVRESVRKSVERRWPAAGQRWVVLQPGARWLNKRWPVERFVELVRVFPATTPKLEFVILGGGQDRELGKTIAEAAPGRCLDLTGRLTLAEMVEWIRRCDLMVTNDTGPMHVAAALQKPIVALFGPTDPRRTGPYRQSDGVLQTTTLPCVPCLKSRCFRSRQMECLENVSVSAVIQAVEQRLRLRTGVDYFSTGCLAFSQALIPPSR